MTLLSYDQILTTFEKPEDFQKLLTNTPKSDYGQLQNKILKTLNEMVDEFINIKKDPKTLLNNLDRITKVFSELFSKKTTNRDGLSLLLESTLLITKRMSQWTVTRNSCSLHRKWLLIGGVYAELKLSSKALESMTDFLLLLEESKKTYTEKEYEYFEKTITHATFIKLQCFEDLKLLQSHQIEFISTYQQWFNSNFQYSDKPQLYHDALSIKFYNKTVYFLQSFKSITGTSNIMECNTLIYHCSLIAWKSLAMTRNTIKFFDRLFQFLIAIQKNGYQNESNCWKLIKDILMLIKSEMFITMLSQTTLEPSFITSLSMISIWSVTTKHTSNTLIQECNEITNEYIKNKRESKEISRLYSSELIIIQLFSWVTRCIILVNRIKSASSSSNVSPSEIIEFEKELKQTLALIHTTTEKSLMTTEFLIDNSNPTNTVDSKFIYFKLLGLLLNSLIEQGLINSSSSIQTNTTINPQIKNQIQLFSQYYLLIPSLAIKWIQQFEQQGKLLPAKQMQPINLLHLEDFIRSYIIASIENFKRFQGSINQDFKLQFNDINRDLITISLEYSSGISFLEELSSYLFMLGSQFNNKLVSHDYDSAIFYFESSIKILNKLISIGNNSCGTSGSNGGTGSNNNNNNVEKHFESLSISFFYLSQIHLKIKNYSKSHQYSIESIKSFLREKRSFTDVIHNNNFSNGSNNGSYNGITKRRLSIQEILKHFATTQYSLFKDINKSYNANENVLPKFNGISFINDIVTIENGSGQQQSQDLEFKIQLFDMALSNFNQIITSSNGHQLMYTQIDRILNVLVSDKHPILHGRFLMEKAKLLRFYNPMKQDIEFIFQQSIELIKSTNLEQDKPFESAIFNELAKVHFWRAITNVEIHQNQCKDILKFLNDEKNRLLSSNTTPIASPVTESSSSSSSSHSLDHLETISTSSSSSSSTYSSKNSTNGSNGSNNGSNSTTSSYSIENELFSSNNSICNFIKSTDQNRFRSPIGSENSIISKEFKLSLNLWSKLLESLIKPIEKLGGSTTSTKDIETNLKSFISPHTTLSLLYSISDIYSFEGDYVSSIFTLKLVIGFVKCLFSNNSLCYLTEISKCYNTIASHYLEMKNTFKANQYLEQNKQLISTFQNILVSDKLEPFQITYQIHHFELQYTNLNGSNSQLEIDHVSNEIIKLYEYCLKHINRFEISLFMKISKIVSNIYIAQTNSAMAFTVSNKLIQCIFTAMPIESIDLIKGQKKQFKIDQQKDSNNNDSTTTTTAASNSSISSSIDNREIGMLQVTTSSKWSSLKICLDSLLHISSIFELRGRPKEAQYYYERGLLIGIIYGSIKVTCEFLTEIGELFYSKQKYVDSKINLDLVLFLISRHTINGGSGNNNQIEPSLLKTMILSNMLLGDLYRKQLLISQSVYHYNKSLSLINNLYNDENQLLSKFNSILNITNDSTPKESRLIKLLSSKSLISKIKSRQSIINSNSGSDEVEEIKNHLSSFELRIKGKLARLLISQNKFTLAIETLEQLINDKENEGDDGATTGKGGKYCNDITLSILEFQLGRAYYSSVDSNCKDEIWSRTITGTNLKVHPSILSARELMVNSFNRVGKYNIIKLNSSICRHIALTTGQLLPYLTCHFINLSIGIKSRHDMQSIVSDEKKKPNSPNQLTIGIKESLFSWNGGIEIPNQLNDINFLKKLKSIYCTDLPIDWKTCSLTIEDNHLLIVKLISNQIPILVRSKIQSLDNESFDINKSNSNVNISQGDDEDYNQVIKTKLENDEFESEDELELELEVNDQDDESESIGGNNIEDNFYSNKSYEINDGESSNGSSNDGSIKISESSSMKIQYNIVDKIRSNLKIIDCENLFNNRENSTTDKKAWFLKRKTLEFEIGKVVEMVDSLFGVWKTLLIGSISNVKIKDKFDKIKDKTMESILSIAVVKKFDNVLFDCIFYGFPILGERAIVDGIIELMNYQPLDKRSTSLDGHPNFNVILKIYNTIQEQVLKCYPVAPIIPPSPDSVSSLDDITFEDYMELESSSSTIPTTTTTTTTNKSTPPNKSPTLSQLSRAPTLSSLSLLGDDNDDNSSDNSVDNSTTTIENLKESFLYQIKQPLVLIIDKNLHFIPFESLESLNEMPLYRLPSFSFQRFLCFDKENNCYSKTMPSIDPKSCYYLLNPSGGLEETQDYFASYFKRKFPEWKGLVGVVPDKLQYKSALENNDIFVYMGHGSGEQYYRGDSIQKLDKCAVAVLMGCKSGLLEEQGDYEPTGIILDFLLAGSKSIIGNIFDVPTGDCDRLTKSFLNKWFFDLKSKKNQPLTMDISSAISYARKSCDWKYLVGGSCVCYGIPTILKSFH